MELFLSFILLVLSAFAISTTPIMMAVKLNLRHKTAVIVLSTLGLGLISYIVIFVNMLTDGYFKEKEKNSGNNKLNLALYGVEFLSMLLPILTVPYAYREVASASGYATDYNLFGLYNLDNLFNSNNYSPMANILLIVIIIGLVVNFFVKDTRKTVGINSVCQIVFFSLTVLLIGDSNNSKIISGGFALFLMTLLSIGTLICVICQGLSVEAVEKAPVEKNYNPVYKSNAVLNEVLFSPDGKTLILCPETMSGVYNVPNGVTSIASSAFKNCHELTTIVIPDSLTSIGSAAFQNCTGLRNAAVPYNTKNIEASAFEGCINLEHILIHDPSTEIGPSAFKNCLKLTIHSAAGGSVERYAKGHNISFDCL